MARNRPCLGTPGNHCPALTTHHAGRCDHCRHAADQARGTTYQRGYDQTHTQLRQHWEPIVRAGRATCWRCTRPIAPDAEWDLGHDDADRAVHRGPEHPSCNRGRRPADPPVTMATRPATIPGPSFF